MEAKKDVRLSALKELKKQSINQFLSKYAQSFSFGLSKEHKVKLCSSDAFGDTISDLSEKHRGKPSPTIISHVSGFYETASLAGLTATTCKKGTKPFVMFFDRESNNIQNAIFNTLLINISKNKEEFLTRLFSLGKADVVKAFDSKTYTELYAKAVEHFNDPEKKEEEIKEYIEKNLIDSEMLDDILGYDFSFKGLKDYVNGDFSYNPDYHYNLLMAAAKEYLPKEMFSLFSKVARNICDYLGAETNFKGFIEYLSDDLKCNKNKHILNNDQIYSGFKGLMQHNGMGNIKFLPGIDISTPEGLESLKSILEDINIISKENDTNKFPIDMAVIPHIGSIPSVYGFIKQNVQDYVVSDRSKTQSKWTFHPTVTLNIHDFKSIGAQFIKDERDNRKPLTHLKAIEPVKGFPLLTFMAGANYGNIYHSEVDTQNMVDMAVADGVDTVFIQGLFYATYYHHQTSRRLLTDPEYETFDSRLRAAKTLVKRLNDKGIKVVYQMGDEETHLYQDMFKIYLREQGINVVDFLKREDLRQAYDWIRPIIIEQLIPYLIRRGEDVTRFSTDEETMTRVSEVCHALKAYNEGLPLGDLAKYIEPEYLEDTDMFKVVYEDVISYDENDPALSVNLISNPNYSHNTQYGNPDDGVKKYIHHLQTGAVSKYPLEEIPQLTVDSRQGYMSLEVTGDQTILNVPQMINDEWYIAEKGLLPGIKNRVLEDPTHKRVTQTQTKPNYPGGWTISGDVREVQRIVPYYKRVREVMEHVQKTGEGLPELAVFHLNDIQLGSPTERIEYFLKALDYFFYKYKARGIWGNGDFCQGWNYSKFANESRYLGSMSMSQQMEGFVKLQEPWLLPAFGTVKPSDFVFEDPDAHIKSDEDNSFKIIRHLLNNKLIEMHSTDFSDATYIIDKEIDYETVDLKLPRDLKTYESYIREKLSSIHRLWFYDIEEGNHEINSDWNDKGYNLITQLVQKLNDYNKSTGGDTEIKFAEYFVNRNGDIVHAPFGFREINGYGIAYGHVFRSPGKANSGKSAPRAMSNYFESMGLMSNTIHRAFMGHLHIYSTAVINNMMVSVTGGAAGQSGYEQALGYFSQPLFVIDTYMPDGRIVVDTIGTKFLDSWEIKNPYVKKMGLDNFIDKCLTQEAPTFGGEEPKKVHDLKVRKLVPSGSPQRIGPKIG